MRAPYCLHKNIFFSVEGWQQASFPLEILGSPLFVLEMTSPSLYLQENAPGLQGKPRGNNGNTGVVVIATYWLFCHVISHAYFFLRTYRATLAAVFTTIATLFLQKKMHIFF